MSLETQSEGDRDWGRSSKMAEDLQEIDALIEKIKYGIWSIQYENNSVGSEESLIEAVLELKNIAVLGVKGKYP